MGNYQSLFTWASVKVLPAKNGFFYKFINIEFCMFFFSSGKQFLDEIADYVFVPFVSLFYKEVTGTYISLCQITVSILHVIHFEMFSLHTLFQVLANMGKCTFHCCSQWIKKH